ncbi:MAG: PqqD family peptide modification chaperone [Eubacteriales bacterium]|nr:PqqD family peptide modification chaperone [Eubacteriales bacterium]
MMRLIDGAYFFECEDMVYLRNVNDGHDYIFNSIVSDILRFIKETPDCSEEMLCDHLKELYEVEDGEEFRQDIHAFLAELMDSGLIGSEQSASPSDDSVVGQVERLYEKNGMVYSAAFELTYRCSEKCIHCYVDDDCSAAAAQELTVEEYKDILHQLKEMGCVKLLLTGGEVCLRRDMADIAGYAVKLGFLVDIYTNGISMTDDQFGALCNMKLNSVSFSLYSGDPGVHDAITQVPGSFEKTLKRAMMFKCAGVDTFIKTVVIRQNLDTLEELFRLGERLHIDVTPATSISNTHLGRSAQTFRLDTPKLRGQALQILKKFGYKPAPSAQRDLDGSVCKAGITSLSIDPYGGVHPCLAFTAPIGNVRETPLERIWQENEFLKSLRSFRFRDLTPECATCSYRNHCAVCLGDAYEESGGRFGPGCDSCHWAKSCYEALWNPACD